MTSYLFGGDDIHPTVLHWKHGTLKQGPDDLAEEQPLEIRVRGRSLSVTMRSPGRDEELASGLLFTEGLIRQRQDIRRIVPCERNEDGNRVHVQLAPEVTINWDAIARYGLASASCGLCGKADLDSICQALIRIESPFRIDAATLEGLPSSMRKAQTDFRRTGGMHAAAVFDANGELLVLREDVGRHNAVDKVIGHALQRGLLPLDQHLMLVSGRSSFEIMQKAMMARIPLVAAVSAPSSLAVGLAQATGQTLVGFLREQRMNIYTHPDRIRFGGTSNRLRSAGRPAAWPNAHDKEHD